MDFETALATCWSKASNFQGRAGRPEFWYWFLFVWAGLGGIVLLALVVTVALHSGKFGAMVALAAFFLYFGFVFLPTVSALVRRLHDVGMTGWLALIAFIPYVGAIVLIVIAALPGKQGSNVFGAGGVQTPETAHPQT